MPFNNSISRYDWQFIVTGFLVLGNISDSLKYKIYFKNSLMTLEIIFLKIFKIDF